MVILANIFSAIGCSFLAYSTFAKKKDKMLLVQICDCLFNFIACLFIGGYSAAVSNAIAGFRNYLTAKNKNTPIINGLFAVILVVLGLSLNKNGFIGILPILAGVIYTTCSYILKSAQSLRYVICFNMILWFIHDFSIGLYVSSFFDIMILAVSFFNIIRLKEKTKNDKKKFSS